MLRADAVGFGAARCLEGEEGEEGEEAPHAEPEPELQRGGAARTDLAATAGGPGAAGQQARSECWHVRCTSLKVRYSSLKFSSFR